MAAIQASAHSLDLLDVMHPTVQALALALSDEDIPSKARSSTATRACLRAASNGDSDVLEYLLKDQSIKSLVNLDAVDEDGSAALVLATCFGHGDCVRLLIEAGADPSTSKDRLGWTALHWAAQNNDLPMASYLVNHHSPIDVKSFKGLLPCDLAKRDSDGEALRDILQAALDARSDVDFTHLQKRKDVRKKEQLESKRKLDLALESVQTLQLDANLLDLEPTSPVPVSLVPAVDFAGS